MFPSDHASKYVWLFIGSRVKTDFRQVINICKAHRLISRLLVSAYQFSVFKCPRGQCLASSYYLYASVLEGGDELFPKRTINLVELVYYPVFGFVWYDSQSALTRRSL